MKKVKAEINRDNEIIFGKLRLIWFQQWSDIFHYKKMNWIEMNIFNVHFERAYYKETFEINLSLLGFNVCIEWWFGNKNNENKN